MEDDEDEDEELLLLRIKALKSTTRVNINVEFTSDSDNDVSVSKKKKAHLKRRKKVDTPKKAPQEVLSSGSDDDEEEKLRQIALSSLQKGKSRSRLQTPSAIQHDLISSTSGDHTSSQSTNYENNTRSLSRSLADDLNQSAIIDFAIERPILPIAKDNTIVLPELSVNDSADHVTEGTHELLSERQGLSTTTTGSDTHRDGTSSSDITALDDNVDQGIATTLDSEVQGIVADAEHCDDVLSLCASDKDENELVDMLLPINTQTKKRPVPTLPGNCTSADVSAGVGVNEGDVSSSKSSTVGVPPVVTQESSAADNVNSSIPPNNLAANETNKTIPPPGDVAGSSLTDSATTTIGFITGSGVPDDAQPGPSGYVKPTIIHGYDSESEESLMDTTPSNGDPSQSGPIFQEETDAAVSSLGTNEEENDNSDGKDAKDSTCSVCLGPFDNRSFLNFCFHSFCYACIMQWSELSRSCPLCKSKYTSLIHSVNTDLDYETYEFPTDLPTPEDGSTTISTPPEFSETMEDGRRFRYRSTMVDPEEHERKRNERERLQRDFVQSTQERRMKRRLKWSGAAHKDFRKSVYKKGLKIKNVKQRGTHKYRDISPKFFADNPALKHRLVPWLLRDLHILLGDDDESIRFVMSLILRVISTISMNEAPFREQLRPFLFEQTDIFVDELVSFASSPYDIRGYDSNVRYSKPEKEVEIVGVSKPPINVSDSEAAEETKGIDLLHEVFLADQDGEGPLTVHDGDATPDNSDGLSLMIAPPMEVPSDTLLVTVQNENALNGEKQEEEEEIEEGDDEEGNESESDDFSLKQGTRKQKKGEKKKKGKRKRRRSKEGKERRVGKAHRKKKKVKKEKDGKVKDDKEKDATPVCTSVNITAVGVDEDLSAAFLRKDESELIVEGDDETTGLDAEAAKSQFVIKPSAVNEKEQISKGKRLKRSKKLVEMAKKHKRRSKYKHLKREKRLKKLEKSVKRKRRRNDSSSGEDVSKKKNEVEKVKVSKKAKKNDEKRRRIDSSSGGEDVEKKTPESKRVKATKKVKRTGEKRRRMDSSSDEDVVSKDRLEKKGDWQEKERDSSKAKKRREEVLTSKKPDDPPSENEKRRRRHKGDSVAKKTLKRKRDPSENERSSEKKRKNDKNKISVEGKDKRKKVKFKKRKRNDKHNKEETSKNPEKEGSGKDVADKELRTKIDKIRSLMVTKRSTVSSDDDDDDFLNSQEVKDLLSRYKYNDNKDLIKDGDAYRTRGEMVRELLLIEKAITRRKEKKQQKQNSKNDSSKSNAKGLPNGKGKAEVKVNGTEALKEKAMKKAEREKSYKVLIQELQEIEGRINSCRSSLQAKPSEAGVTL